MTAQVIHSWSHPCKRETVESHCVPAGAHPRLTIGGKEVSSALWYPLNCFLLSVLLRLSLWILRFLGQGPLILAYLFWCVSLHITTGGKRAKIIKPFHNRHFHVFFPTITTFRGEVSYPWTNHNSEAWSHLRCGWGFNPGWSVFEVWTFFCTALHLSSLAYLFLPHKGSNNTLSFHERVPSLPSEVEALCLVQPPLSTAGDVSAITLHSA